MKLDLLFLAQNSERRFRQAGGYVAIAIIHYFHHQFHVIKDLKYS